MFSVHYTGRSPQGVPLRVSSSRPRIIADGRLQWRGYKYRPDRRDFNRLVTSLVTLLTATVMSLEAARNLSISDLLHLLNEKLGLEYTRLRETHLPPVTSAASLESEVTMPRSILIIPSNMAAEPNGQSFRSKSLKPEHTVS